MRVAAAFATLLAVCAGCTEPTTGTASGDVPEDGEGWSFPGLGPLQEDTAKFHSEGAFDAALAEGGKLARAGEPPDGDGGPRPSIPMQVDDLDAAWGEGRYRLSMIHWWG